MLVSYVRTEVSYSLIVVGAYKADALSSVALNDYWDADDISFLSEPVTILHNVKGGAGIVATYTSKTFQTEFKHKFK